MTELTNDGKQFLVQLIDQTLAIKGVAAMQLALLIVQKLTAQPQETTDGE